MKRIISLVLILVLCMVEEVANADFIFGTPTNLGPTVNSSAWDANPSISADGLSLFFQSERGGGFGGDDIWVTRRATSSDPWGTPVNLGPTVNSSSHDFCPCISADDLSLFFTSDRPGGYGYYDLWVTWRATTEDPWGTPVNLGPTVNSSASEVDSAISVDGLTLFFGGYSSGPQRPGGFGMSDLWVTTRKTKHDPWTEPVNLGPTVNSASTDYVPSISADGLMLFFGSNRPGGYGQRDLWLTTRATANKPWGEPLNLGTTVNTSSHDFGPFISADGLELYFHSARPGGSGSMDLWQAPILPIVDLNGDGIVDAADMCIMVDHWGTDEPLCDIGPMPWGDGIVDVQDLIVLSEHLFEEIYPIGLIEYWKLDEEEGDIAYNSIGDNHGILSGNPTWQPDSGQIAGALEFDGINDYVETDFVLNPAYGAFSVFAWVKGGAPGQVIISQSDGIGTGETWLGMDALGGNLMTGLRPPGTRSPTPPMVSDFVITDGQWHHVGIVVTAQGVRNLYADGMRVAADTKSVNLPSSDGGLYIGTGKTLEAGTFFSGLIDDVRIYDAALSAEEIAALAR